jgi:hypothetical protein
MFLVTDPIDEEYCDYFEVIMDGVVQTVDAEHGGDGTVRLHHDITDIDMGNHSVVITAFNAWGGGEPSDPFDFVKALPPKVSGIGLSQV